MTMARNPSLLERLQEDRRLIDMKREGLESQRRDLDRQAADLDQRIGAVIAQIEARQPLPEPGNETPPELIHERLAEIRHLHAHPSLFPAGE